MGTLDFGVRRVNYNRVLSLPKPGLREYGIEDRGMIARRMNESGDLVLTPITSACRPETLECSAQNAKADRKFEARPFSDASAREAP